MKIQSKDDFFDLIQKANKDVDAFKDIAFDGWPIISITYKGDAFEDGQIPSRFATSISKLQRDIKRLYCLSNYGVETKRLSYEEKELIEFSFKVSEGSLKTIVDFDKFLDKIAEGVKDKVEPKHLLYGLGLFFIYSSTAKWIDHIENESIRNNNVEIIKQSGQNTTDAIEILTKALEKSYSENGVSQKDAKKRAKETTKRIKGLAVESKEKLVKSLKKDEIIILNNDEEYDYETIKNNTKQKRQQYEEAEFKTSATIYKVDFDKDKNKPTVSYYDEEGKPRNVVLDIIDQEKTDKINMCNGKDEQITLIISARESEDGTLKDQTLIDIE